MASAKITSFFSGARSAKKNVKNYAASCENMPKAIPCMRTQNAAAIKRP